VKCQAEALKTEVSMTDVPVPRSLSVEVLAHTAQWPGEWILTDPEGRQVGPWRLERAIRSARTKVPGLPEGFRHHDPRHYLASFLIAHGAEVKLCPGPAKARLSQDDARHLRAPLA
jgi:hypothetical protein